MHVGMCSAPGLRVCVMLVMRAWCCWHHWNVHSQGLEPSMFAVGLSSTGLVHVATSHELDVVYPGPLWACLRSDMVTIVRYAHNLCLYGGSVSYLS